MQTNASNNTMKLAQQAYKHGEEASQKLIVATHAGGGMMPDSIYTVGNLAVGILHTMAMMIGKAKHANNIEEFEAETAINPETLLFSVILINKMSPDYDKNKKCSICEFGPHIIYEALETYEKYTGKKPDEFLVPGMVEAGREIGVFGKDAMAAFIERSKSNPGGISSLN